MMRRIADVVSDIERFLNEGDSIGVARRKAIGEPASHKAEVVVMRSPLYVSMLNKYMVKVGKPIFYVLVKTDKGPRLTKLNRKRVVTSIPTTLPHS